LITTGNSTSNKISVAYFLTLGASFQNSHTQKKLYGCSDSAGKEVELFVDGVLSFAINVSIRYVEYEDAIAQASWSRPYVTAFIEGQWEADILKISQQQIAIDRDFSAKAGADRMQRSRERFGL
jgi:hypothetical protein